MHKLRTLVVVVVERSLVFNSGPNKYKIDLIMGYLDSTSITNIISKRIMFSDPQYSRDARPKIQCLTSMTSVTFPLLQLLNMTMMIIHYFELIPFF